MEIGIVGTTIAQICCFESVQFLRIAQADKKGAEWNEDIQVSTIPQFLTYGVGNKAETILF